MMSYLKLNPALTPLQKALELEQRFLAEHNLIYTDKMSMAAGVEVRVPFWIIIWSAWRNTYRITIFFGRADKMGA